MAPLVFVVLLMACGKPSDNPTTPSRKTNLAQVGVKYDLAEYFPVAEVHGDVKRLVPGMPGSERFFTAGWNKAEVTATSETFAWTTTRDAVVDIPRVHPEDFRLALDLMPHAPSPALPPQRISIAWNGDTVTTTTLSPERKRIEIVIPAARQHYGLNRLELNPGYWIRPSLIGLGADNRDLGIRCFGIDLSEMRATEIPTVSDALAKAEGESIHQRTGSLVSYHFALPRRARLSGQAILRSSSVLAHGTIEGGVALMLRTADKSEERALLNQSLDGFLQNPAVAIDADLGEVSGSPACINLVFWTAKPAPAGLEVEWNGLKIEGTAEEPVAANAEILHGKYNIVLVLFDSLRADHIEPYGSSDVKTPALAQLAVGGVTFTNARSNAPLTPISVASMMTSTFPAEHGVNGHGIGQFNYKLGPELPYLPELLQHAGYRTMAVFNNPVVSAPTGFDRGFDVTNPYYEIHGRKFRGRYHSAEDHAGFVWAAYVEPHIKSSKSDPFFIYIHEQDPHAPYTPKLPFDTMYGHGEKNAFQQSPYSEMLPLIQTPGLLRPQDIDRLHALYKGETSYMDGYFGFMMHKFREAGLEKNTLMIFVSDHGEEFYEHGKFGHGIQFHEQMLRVPLIMSLAGVLPSGLRVGFDVQLSDIPPTLLDLIGESIPPGMRGRSLLPLLSAPADFRPDRPAFALNYGASGECALFGKWKLIRNNYSLAGGTPPFGFELYDLAADPGERIDRWPDEPIVGFTLRQQLLWQQYVGQRGSTRSNSAQKPNQMDPEMIQRLRALGYLN